ncbi:MAG: hypothetical protein H6868_10435 [Rhodospirillales bacterium]|nr:hypothetical protein [Rhodospirillales bacterium]
MVGSVNNILTPVLRGQLFALQKTARTMDDVQLRLATGKKVISALDNPQNFFASRALINRSNDLARLLDGIGQNIQALKVADDGLTAISRLLNQIETEALEIRQTMQTLDSNLSELILADDPVAYWRLNETSGVTATNLGSVGTAINGTYTGSPTLGSDPLYAGGGDVIPEFNGTNQAVLIPDNAELNLSAHAERSMELIFNANDITNRQVLYEEGGNVNSITTYVYNGRVYVTARDQGAWGPAQISAPIEQGKTYHLALTFDYPNGEFKGFLNGERIGIDTSVNAIFPSHSADISIGRMSQDSWYHDGSINGTGLYFNGRISDVAIYNSVLSENTIAARYEATWLEQAEALSARYNALLEHIDPLVRDSHYRGLNLLNGENLITYFNEDRTSYLETEGDDFTRDGLGLNDAHFISVADVDDVLDDIRDALLKTRQFGTTLAVDLNIIQTRDDFSRELINTLTEGSDDLTVADQNEEGAKYLALQVRQSTQFVALSFTRTTIADFLLDTIA